MNEKNENARILSAFENRLRAGVMEYVRPPQKSAAFRNTIAGRRTIERCKSRPLV